MVGEPTHPAERRDQVAAQVTGVGHVRGVVLVRASASTTSVALEFQRRYSVALEAFARWATASMVSRS